MSDNDLVRNNKTHYLALISVGNEVLHTDSQFPTCIQLMTANPSEDYIFRVQSLIRLGGPCKGV